MKLDTALGIAQIVIAALLAGLILIQPKGVGLGQVFAGEGNVYRTKRGVEKIVSNLTILTAIVFCGTAIARLFV
ncbi:MAG: preprotein translocase subunit SecG [Candidatus Andersenbacteria bacterium]